MRPTRSKSLEGRLKAVIVLTASVALLPPLAAVFAFPLAAGRRPAAGELAAVFVAAGVLALGLAFARLRHVLRPLRDLAATADRITESRDYSLRATELADDELGRLTDGFNHVLEQIGTSDEGLRRANDELARSNAELERFAYVASHDLQEPLRIVTSFSELLEDSLGDGLEEEPRKFLGYVVQASRRMRAQLDALLDYSRVSTRGQTLAPVDCNLALDGALANLQIAIEDAGAEIQRQELPVVVGDLQQLTRLFQNLIGNALKFRSPEVVPWVRVACSTRPDVWMMSVADNGIGVDAQAHERIFEVFQRLHHRSEYPGTGIGLAICRRIVQRHGGEIRVESTPGEGSTFRFTLPRLPEEVDRS